jgi:hypothetical protein
MFYEKEGSKNNLQRTGIQKEIPVAISTKIELWSNKL